MGVAKPRMSHDSRPSGISANDDTHISPKTLGTLYGFRLLWIGSSEGADQMSKSMTYQWNSGLER